MRAEGTSNLASRAVSVTLTVFYLLKNTFSPTHIP